MKGAHDGVWNGTRYYACEPNRGIFVPMLDVEPFNAGKRKGSAGIVRISTYTVGSDVQCEKFTYTYIANHA